MTVELEPMSDDRYTSWLPSQIEEYARDKVRAGIWSEVEAHDLSAAEMASILPAGLATPDHHVFIGTIDREEIGNIWFLTKATASGEEAFIYNIEVDPGRQGKGHGRALLESGERWCSDRGVAVIRLNVFAYNATAIKLYETSGYATTNMTMMKRL